MPLGTHSQVNSDTPDMSDVSARLECMSMPELLVVAKKLRLTGCSNLRKDDLVARILRSDTNPLRQLLFPGWWNTHYNHVYGIITVFGVILSIVFFVWPFDVYSAAGSPANWTQVIRSVPTIEKPINFTDYVAMPPTERQAFFQSRMGEQFVWEGYLKETIGFESGSLTGVPYDTPVAIRITPSRSPTPQLTAKCDFGELSPTDSGIELGFQLHILNVGQRIRVSGQIAGTADAVVLEDAFLEAVFPIGE